MKLLPGLRRVVIDVAIALVITIVLAAVVVALTPPAARWITLYYLEQQGVQATIGNVDANLFTGTLDYTDIAGHTAHGEGYDIGRLRLSLDYMPLFSKKISLSQLAVNDATIDIRRSPDNALRIGGITVLTTPPRDSGSLDWGLALHRVTIGKLGVHYVQPAYGGQPAIDQTLVLNDSSASGVVSWQPDSDVPLDANIGIGKSRVQIKGRIAPFGQTITGRFDVKTHDFGLDLLAPITQPTGLRHLTGTVNGQQQIDIRYDPSKALSIETDGKAAWQKGRLALANGVNLASDRLDWQGKLTMRLLRAAGKPATIDSDGRMQIAGFSLHQPNNVTLEQKNGDWQGTTRIVLATPAIRVTADGGLESKGVNVTRPDNTRFNVAALNWQSTFDLAAGETTQIDTDGSAKANELTFVIPETASFDADRLSWQGRTRIHSAQRLARQVHGKLTANTARLTFPSQPVTLAADRLLFNGEYSEKPNPSGGALALKAAGDLDGHKLAVMNNAINAPWLAMLQIHAKDLNIDGIDSIALAGLTAHGVRLLGDTDTDAAVLTSITTKARQFRLEKRRRYRLADLDIDGANIHLRRDAAGMGVIAKYVGGSETPSQSKSGGASSQASSTYAIDHLAVTGPAVAFTDVAVTPSVALTGSDLNFVLEDLDTDRPDRNARYRLSLDVGAYGHLDSRGEIAPLAPGGVHMNLDAWLRSLAMGPLSGYLNAAMDRRIARGVADGTLHLEATKGQLDGLLDTTLSNFRLVKNPATKRTIALGLSMDTALTLVRGKADAIHFQTRILGDVTNPYFSIKNLVREAVLAGLRTALTSDYSPLGMLNNARKALANLGKSLVSKPVGFEPGRHYVRPEDRAYLGRIAQAMYDKPGLTLTVRGQAVPGDADAMSLFQGAEVDPDNRVSLQELARKRGQAVQDYLAARRVSPDRIELADPVVDHDRKARPEARLSLGGN